MRFNKYLVFILILIILYIEIQFVYIASSLNKRIIKIYALFNQAITNHRFQCVIIITLYYILGNPKLTATLGI